MRTALALLVLALLLAGGGRVSGAAEEEPAGIRITGSGYTMPRFTRAWAADFEATRGVTVAITPTGTSTGPPALLRGEADIAGMTRPLNAAEREAFRRRHGREPVGIPVAADAVVVFVNDDNPLERLTLVQVDAVFSRSRLCGADRDAARWGELGLDGGWADRAISLYGRRPGSGTGTFFRNHALCGGEYKQWLQINPGGESAARAIAESRWGIGFGSRSDGREGMKALALARRAGEPYAPPSAEAVASGAYPLGRMLWFYVLPPADGPLDPTLRDFLEFVLMPGPQEAVAKAGFLPVSRETAAPHLARLP